MKLPKLNKLPDATIRGLLQCAGVAALVAGAGGLGGWPWACLTFGGLVVVVSVGRFAFTRGKPNA